MASEPAEQPVLKRKRITVACNSCRAKKSKCDGKRPICGRCAGYDYTCSWGNEALHGNNYSHTTSRAASNPEEITSPPEEVFRRYHQAVHALTPQLSPGAQAEVNKSLACIQAHLCPRASSDTTTASSQKSTSGSSVVIPCFQDPRYVGEVSDIHFFNLVKQSSAAASGEGGPGQGTHGDEVDNYDAEALTTARSFQNPLSDLPSRTQVDTYLTIYFSTVHEAYPFVDKRSFKARLDSLQADGSTAELTHSWLSLLYALLAVGAYYDSFRPEGRSAASLHQKLFNCSLVLSHYGTLERSLTQVSALLAQCFYLLITSEIERCWVSLGLAVRLGQSIGLHVSIEEHGSTTPATTTTPRGEGSTAAAGLVLEQPEVRNKVWYSLYVLDRLTALQLGRPPAIADDDCHVPLPRRADDSLDLDVHSHASHGEGAFSSSLSSYSSPDGSTTHSHPSAGEYFVRIIEFSSIIGRVLRECYQPRRTIAARLQNTKYCDELLLAWKQKLPRFLRFDLGHAFEKSVTLKRQRNMLAIKFHHLRTLIYRPYLYYTCIDGGTSLPPDQSSRSREYGRICASEAQSIARLMHNVTDTVDIVMNYPWWQMVSCLVCAGSVMVMAGAFMRRDVVSSGGEATASISNLEEDVETCMHVLKALSDNSRGSKLAWNMMKDIRARGDAAMWPMIQPDALNWPDSFLNILQGSHASIY
ncbi:hypothetical protein M406DRAFT_343947 [Cryphonectria parasitica EP155]|uniref:Zn(2)-C6 fungal-type domain-containing protein n=1 Tax=Cryphonectria parasitica (strain ATCC 38755 / EP155) TaxID=660469 RepID=A0A9P4YBH5_CRYP1|nr:uncharacterized protein M406DRAFT_343947 [Cryphonectria parasitica EP155]KAF3769990.1 hypothetical protein M406DRAFT_343947 [Cryphonectria parasitica EP155]